MTPEQQRVWDVKVAAARLLLATSGYHLHTALIADAAACVAAEEELRTLRARVAEAEMLIVDAEYQRQEAEKHRC